MSRPVCVLFLTQRLPYAPNRGDRLRAYHMIQAMNRGASVSVVSLVHDRDEASQVCSLSSLVSSVEIAPVQTLRNYARVGPALATSRPLTHVLLDSPAMPGAIARTLSRARPDVVLAYCSSMARFALERPLAGLPLVIDMVDADSAKWGALAKQGVWPRRWIYGREARTLGAFEARAMRSAHATVAVNEREVALLKQLAPDARVGVLENGVDMGAFSPTSPPARSSRVVFCGVMNYEPNEAGAVWLAREIWPRVRSAVRSAELRIVGASPTPVVLALANPALGVTVTGAVPDVRPELWAAALATAPLHTARGVQNKVLEAVAAGLPCVVTPAVHAGLPKEVLEACPVADTAEAFAERISDLLARSPEERRRFATADLDSLSWERRLAPLLPLLLEAASVSRPGALGTV